MNSSLAPPLSHKGSNYDHSVTNRDSFDATASHNYQDFQNFLEQSPYCQSRKRQAKNTQDPNEVVTEKAFNKDIDQYLTYFEVRKKDINLPSEIPAESNDLMMGMSPIGLKDIDDSPEHNFIFGSPLQGGMDEVKMNTVGGFGMTNGSGGWGSPTKGSDSSPIDKNAKKLMETMQAKIIKLEMENRKLKKEVGDLTSQNKKYQAQVASFITEQENFNRTKDTYEKRVKRLQDYCKNNDESMNALKRILSLQEDELYEIVSKKNVSSFAPPVHRGSSISTDTKRSIKKTLTKDIPTIPEDITTNTPVDKAKSPYSFVNNAPLSKSNSMNESGIKAHNRSVSQKTKG